MIDTLSTESVETNDTHRQAFPRKVLLHTALMLPVCHGLEGKFHPMGSGRRDIRRRGCTVYICGACVEKLGEAGEELREEA